MDLTHNDSDVYKLAINFITTAHTISDSLPKGRSYLANQLQRSALNIILNITEGAGKIENKDKVSFFSLARNSTAESSALLDVCNQLTLLEGSSCLGGKTILNKIVKSLTKLIVEHKK